MASTDTTTSPPLESNPASGFVIRDRRMMQTIRERCGRNFLASSWFEYLQDAAAHAGGMRARQTLTAGLKRRFCDQTGIGSDSLDRATRFLCKPWEEGGAGLLRVVRAGRRGRPTMIQCLLYPDTTRTHRTGRDVHQEQQRAAAQFEQPQQLAAAVGDVDRCPEPRADQPPVSLLQIPGNETQIRQPRQRLQSIPDRLADGGKNARGRKEPIPPPNPPRPEPSSSAEDLDPRVGEALSRLRKPEDLRDVDLLLSLANKLAEIDHLPAEHTFRRRVVAAAVKAGSEGGRPVQLFRWLVQGRHWDRITPEHEETAGHRIAQHLELGQYAPPPDLPDLTDDDREQSAEAMEQARADLAALWEETAPPDEKQQPTRPCGAELEQLKRTAEAATKAAQTWPEHKATDLEGRRSRP